MLIRARYLRQTLIFSDYLTPELNSVFSKYCNNINGKLKIRRENEAGTINEVALPIQQVRRFISILVNIIIPITIRYLRVLSVLLLLKQLINVLNILNQRYLL
jgi:hypothetical protein